MLEETEVLPGAPHGVVDGAKLTGIGIREAAAGLEVDDEFKGSRGGIEGGGNDFPRGGKSERLGEKMIGGHESAAYHKARRVAHKNPPLRRVSHPILAEEPCGQLSSNRHSDPDATH